MPRKGEEDIFFLYFGRTHGVKQNRQSINFKKKRTYILSIKSVVSKRISGKTFIFFTSQE